MKKEAEQFAEEDKKKREEVDIKNEADALSIQIDKLLKDNAEKISDEHKKKCEEANESLKKLFKKVILKQLNLKKKKHKQLFMKFLRSFISKILRQLQSCMLLEQAVLKVLQPGGEKLHQIKVKMITLLMQSFQK